MYIYDTKGVIVYNEQLKRFDFDIMKSTRGLEVHPYHTTEVVGYDSIELNVFGYANPTEAFWKWSAKAQREYTKANATDARDSFVFRYPAGELEEE